MLNMPAAGQTAHHLVSSLRIFDASVSPNSQLSHRNPSYTFQGPEISHLPLHPSDWRTVASSRQKVHAQCTSTDSLSRSGERALVLAA